MELLNSEISMIGQRIACQAAQNESVRILMSMTGIDYFSAMVIASEIGDIHRFDTPSRLVSWAGLCPSVHQSGSSLYMGRMKQGNKKVNWILTQAAQTSARTDERMKQFYQRVVRRYRHSIAITHVANKMIIIIWHMLTNRTLYNERKQNLYDAKLKRMQSAVR
ncbi:hypothetical protein NITUZ_60005 [Candidatus Nitrosotenuis uzonensis]|uniref:Transposase IS116/IS110/IS902 C-terminal domain-containing protein n=2 Tax=Candidatus Nitrosotenuis uzonensis TaxID=1407055 RepID=V6AVE7_9ARCH|nr:hypothetical protein NITUZ_60005 [Candidatus Nitrosotenuis uzonensis]